jgi:serine/threonine protein kinase
MWIDPCRVNPWCATTASMSTPEDPNFDLGASVEALTEGRVLFRRYRLERELGRGGMGVVWLASDQKLDESVALKFLPELIARDADAVAGLLLEVRKTRKLTHRNIVRVHDLVEDGGLAAISMEYLDGGTLRDLRRQQPYGKPFGVFSPDDVLPWMEQLCAGLDDAHQHARVVHRDLKPVNLMVTKSGTLKITDFGLARTLAESMSSFSGKVQGTPGFMSPQQARGEIPTESDDIYAVGATLYDLLTGKAPFFRGDISVIIDQVKFATPPRIADRRRELAIRDAPPLPEHWEKTIASCLAKDPALRPQTAREIASQLARPLASDARATCVTAPVIRRVSLMAENHEDSKLPTRNGEERELQSSRGTYKVVLWSALAAIMTIGGFGLLTSRHTDHRTQADFEQGQALGGMKTQGTESSTPIPPLSTPSQSLPTTTPAPTPNPAPTHQMALYRKALAVLSGSISAVVLLISTVRAVFT